MKPNLWLMFVVLFAGLVLSAETSPVYQVTHLSSNEVGVRCLGSRTMSTRRVADMTILVCGEKPEAKK
jgi:hypothetical protein